MADIGSIMEVNDYGIVFKRPLDANELEQLEVMLEAFGIFVERETKYRSLWKQYGAIDSYHHITSKAARTQFYLEGIEDASDPIDLINYTIFLIRNMRAGRIMNRGEGGEASVSETWRVMDKWWTPEPQVREYRTLAIPGCETITQYREGEHDTWKVQVD